MNKNNRYEQLLFLKSQCAAWNIFQISTPSNEILVFSAQTY